MRYVESPENPSSYTHSLFLAGGITACPNWQQELVELLCTTHWTLINPRQRNFPIHDPSAAKEQIRWEHTHLHNVSAISYWFPKETLCPIVLFELGAWSMTDKPIFVGVHPEYKRRQDVEIQMALARPGLVVVYSLADLAAAIRGAGDDELLELVK